ncbi:MAG: portal protein, partial [Gammaproteobacteria bacterium]
MHLDNFIIAAMLILAVTSVAVALFRHLGLGSVLGLLVAGIVVGPHSPGPAVIAQVEDVRHFAELGVVMLLFVIGLEMQPSRLWSMRRELFGLGSLQVLLTGLVISTGVGLAGLPWGISLLIGMTLALSSTAFVMQLLQERGQLASRHGSGSFAILLMQDLAVVPLLAVLPLLSSKAPVVGQSPLWEQLLIVTGMFFAVWLFGARVVPFALEWLARQNNREGQLLVVLLSVFFPAWAMHQVGISMGLGAFVMGMLLSGSQYNLQVKALIDPYKGLLMSLFFVAVGMSIDLDALGAQPLSFVGHTIALITIKVLVLMPLALLFGYHRADATRIAFNLAQAGEFGFVLFGSALALGIIDDPIFVTAIGVISLSMLFTPLMIRIGNHLADRLEPAAAPGDGEILGIAATDTPTVLIGGYGRVGHTIGTLLESNGIPYIAIERNPELVGKARSEGKPVMYGDLSDLNLLAAAYVERASLIVLTLDDHDAVLKAATLLRRQYPHVPIIARARDLKTCGELLALGVVEAYPEVVESSLRLGSSALAILGVPEESIEMLL